MRYQAALITKSEDASRFVPLITSCVVVACEDTEIFESVIQEAAKKAVVH